MKLLPQATVVLCALLTVHCGNSDEGGGDGDGGLQVGDEVDLNGDGTTDGTAIDTDGDGLVDAYDSNGDGIPDGPLSSSGSGGAGSGTGGTSTATGGTGPAAGGSDAGTGGTDTAAGGADTAAGGADTAAGGADTAAGGADTAAGGTPSGTGGAEGCVINLDCEPPVLPTTGDFAQDCVDRINQFRVGCHCLPPLIRWTEAEACADANAEYDAGTGQAHSGWPSTACPDDSGPLSREMAGWATNECPGWGSPAQIVSGCMRSMYSEGVAWAEQLGRAPTQDDYSTCNGSCYSENGHFIAMTKASHTHVACGIFDDDGEIWSVQNFK